MLWNLFKPKTIEKVVYKEIEPREGWFVHELFQNPLDCTWYCCLCSFHLERGSGHICVEVNECDTLTQAIEEANKLAEKEELNYDKTREEKKKNK